MGRSKAFRNAYRFGYALTVHKAQGSEFQRVAVIVEKPYLVSDNGIDRWLYTAVTRATKELLLVPLI